MSYNKENNEIEIEEDDIKKLLDNPDEYKGMIMDIMKEDIDESAQKCYQLLNDDIINKETDMLLRFLATEVPYNLLLPLLREQLGLSIVTDKDCVTSLENIKKHLKHDDQVMINNIIEFIINDKELDKDSIPEIDLMALLDQIPIDLFTEIYNCADYIDIITE